MKRERRFPVLLFAVCLIAAMPFAWGAGRRDQTGREETVDRAHNPPHRIAPRETTDVERFPSPVPKTGQTGCWNNDGYPIDCAETGQDGEYQAGVSAHPRFKDNGDGTIQDDLTGLIWLKNASCFGRTDWTTALSDAKTLAAGSCGLTDDSIAGEWRLPNVKELLSLIDFGQFAPALPVGHPFSVSASDPYWSSTSVAGGYESEAWILDVGSGHLTLDLKEDGGQVWPVRDGR